jgi:hypothetical protein
MYHADAKEYAIRPAKCGAPFRAGSEKTAQREVIRNCPDYLGIVYTSFML